MTNGTEAQNQGSEGEEGKVEAEEKSSDSLLYADDDQKAQEPDEDQSGEHEEAGTQESDEGQEGDGDTIQSLSDLIASQEWDPEWVDALEVDVKVDGKPAKATMSDLVRSYQIGQAAEHRLEEAKSKAKSIIEDAAARSKGLEGQYEVVAKLIEGAEALIDQDVKGIDWNKLREDDPAEYAAKKQEVADRREAVNKLKQEAGDSWRKNAETMTAERQEQINQLRQVEGEKLLTAIPEWKNEDVAKAEKAATINRALELGFTQEDVANALDHRFIVAIRDSALFRQNQAKSATAKKKVVKAPKVMRPGPKTDQKPKPKDAAEILYG